LFEVFVLLTDDVVSVVLFPLNKVTVSFEVTAEIGVYVMQHSDLIT